jgi:hypothetical protein
MSINPQHITAKFLPGKGLVDLKIKVIPIDNLTGVQNDIQLNKPVQNNIVTPQEKPFKYDSEIPVLPTVYNNKNEYFEVPNKNTTLPDTIRKTAIGNDTKDIIELYSNIFRKINECLPDVISIIKTKIENKTINDQVMALIRLASSLAVDKKRSANSDDDSDECKIIVWNQICDFKTEFFRKVDLTTNLQKKVNAAQIEHALKMLISEKLISEVKELNNTKSTGRRPSPQYKINNFGQEGMSL